MNLINALKQILKNPSDTEDHIISRLRHIIREYESEHAVIKDSVAVKNLYTKTMVMIKQQKDAKQIIKSGFSGLDKVAGGFFPGELIIIGGRPGMGKTQLIIAMVLQMANANPVLYYSFDLSTQLITCRILSILTHIPVNKILQYDLRETEKIKIGKAYDKLSEKQIFINETGYNSLPLMKDQIRKHCREHGIRVVVVDYLQMMSSYRHMNNREQEVGQICREIKNLAKEENLVFIVASQLSRSVEHRGGNKRPFLADLRDSGTIEQDADKVIFLYRPKYYQIESDDLGMSTEGVMELIVAKNRNGGLGIASFMINESFTKFTDYDPANTEFNIDSSRMDDFDVPF